MVWLQFTSNGVLEIISTTSKISTVVAKKLNVLKPKTVLFIHNGVKKVTQNWQQDIEVVSKGITSVNSQRLQQIYGN